MTATILIPTRDRASYLESTLGSIAPQARDAGAELVVIDDGAAAGRQTAQVAARHGARLLSSGGRGANAARNLGVSATDGDPVVMIDDDIEAPAGWLRTLLGAVDEHSGVEVAGGPILAAIDGGGPASCGREVAPITTLDLGPTDLDAEFVWSANMAVRRAALQRIGDFDESIRGRGEEEDWERRYVAAGGRIRYVAAAGVRHRRIGTDARFLALARSAFALGRTARRYDQRKGTPPALHAEVRTLAGCAAHVIRYRCLNMVAAGVAHSLGRVREALAE